MSKCGQTHSLPPRCDSVILGQRLTGPLHEMAIRHATGADRLAPPTLDAGGKRGKNFGRERGIVVLHVTHQGNATPRRLSFIARDSKRRAEGQAKAALDALVQIIGVESQIHLMTSPATGRD